MASLLLMIAILPCTVSSHGIQGAHSEGYIADVIVVDLNCEENQTCVHRPSHIIGYYGADWCEECPEVEAQLENMSEEEDEEQQLNYNNNNKTNILKSSQKIIPVLVFLVLV